VLLVCTYAATSSDLLGTSGVPVNDARRLDSTRVDGRLRLTEQKRFMSSWPSSFVGIDSRTMPTTLHKLDLLVRPGGQSCTHSQYFKGLPGETDAMATVPRPATTRTADEGSVS
jgi:hypothetical protein